MVWFATSCTEDMGSIPNHNNHFFFHQGKNADLSIKVKEVIMMFISYQQEQLRSLKVIHLSLRTTFAELPIGKFSSYTLVSLWSGISSTEKRKGL